MSVWSKRLGSTLLENEAAQLIQLHGERAYEIARQSARNARNKRDRKRARHYAYVALRIAELTGLKIEQDTTT